MSKLLLCFPRSAGHAAFEKDFIDGGRDDAKPSSNEAGLEDPFVHADDFDGESLVNFPQVLYSLAFSLLALSPET